MVMSRRELIQLGTAAAFAAQMPTSVLAQASAGSSSTTKKQRLDGYSRTLHWLRTPQEVAIACHEIGYTSLDLTVRPGSGHVNPDNVKTELPTFVKGLRAEGIEVSMIAPAITEATDPNAEAILDVASSHGIHHYWWGTFRYDEAKPYWPQLDALKPKVEKIAKLNEKYGMKAMAHPRNGAGSVSGAFYDLLYILKNFDPRYVSYQYDTGQLLQARDEDVVLQLRLGAPYIGGFVWKDSVIEPADAPNPDDAFRAAHPRTSAGPTDGAGMGVRTGVAPGGQAPAGGPPRRAPNPYPSRWRGRQVPIGTGLVNVKLICQTLKEIGFDGPMECEPEWPQLGGADQGATELSVPREQVIALLKRDFETVTGAMNAVGL
jgi:sugar phosphate isomerase/epimerase